MKESPVNEFNFDLDISGMLSEFNRRKNQSKRLLKKGDGRELANEEDADHKGWILDLYDGYVYDECSRLCAALGIKDYKVRIMSYSSEDYLDWHVDPFPNTTRINILLTDPFPTVFEDKEYKYKIAIVDATRKKHKFDNTGKPPRAIVRIQINDFTYDKLCDHLNDINIKTLY
jgi:hypothetical protein